MVVVVVVADVVAVVTVAVVAAAVVAGAGGATAAAGVGLVEEVAALVVGVTTGTLVSVGFIAKRSSSGAALPSDGAKGSCKRKWQNIQIYKGLAGKDRKSHTLCGLNHTHTYHNLYIHVKNRNQRHSLVNHC